MVTWWRWVALLSPVIDGSACPHQARCRYPLVSAAGPGYGWMISGGRRPQESIDQPSLRDIAAVLAPA